MKDLILKCTAMFPINEINKIREDVKKQLEEGLVILPPGIELAQVDVHLLEQIKEEIWDDYGSDDWVDWHTCDRICNLIDLKIEKLKGEQE